MAISTSPVVLSGRDAGVLTLTLNRPEVLNGLTDEVLDAVADGCREAAADDGVRVPATRTSAATSAITTTR
jgi:enoyl-CoA hydratase/carnithine racemase